MSRGVWKTVEAKTRKTRVEKTKTKREKEEKEEKTEKRKNDGSEKSSRRIGNWNEKKEIAKSEEEAKKLVPQKFYK